MSLVKIILGKFSKLSIKFVSHVRDVNEVGRYRWHVVLKRDLVDEKPIGERSWTVFKNRARTDREGGRPLCAVGHGMSVVVSKHEHTPRHGANNRRVLIPTISLTFFLSKDDPAIKIPCLILLNVQFLTTCYLMPNEILLAQ